MVDMNNNSHSKEVDYYLRCYNLDFELSTHGKYQINWITNTIIVIPLVITICILNTLVAYIIVIRKQRRLKEPPIMLIFSNTIADMMVGYTLVMTWVPCLILALFNIKSCALFLGTLFFGYLNGTISTSNAILSATDRYLAIYKPFVYAEKIKDSTSKYKNIIIIQWLCSTLIVGASFFTPHLSLFSCVMLILIIIAVIWPPYVYHNIYKTVKSIRHRVQKTESALYAAERHIEQKKDLHVTRITAFMIATLFVCCTPFLVTGTAWLLTMGEEVTDLHACIIWSSTFMMLKSLLNPIIIVMSLSDVKRELKRTFRRKASVKEYSRNISISKAVTMHNSTSDRLPVVELPI